jgi:two-component system alkaline phosphatase synthesis response regulator PhoP
MVIGAMEKNSGGNTESLGRNKKVILIVDGDAMSQFYTSVILQRFDYHVFPVRTAEEALMIMEVTMPLLIITEITLPKMSGVDLLTRLKKDPRTRDVPVLIYAAQKTQGQRDACIQAGCAGYLAHPADHNQLYEAVQKATETTPRHFVRLATWLDVIVSTPGVGDQSAFITAISEHGMFVGTPSPLPHGAAAMFTMQLPKLPNGGIQLQGKVLYSQSGGPGKKPGMGVKFLQVKPEVSALIRTFIEIKLHEGLAVSIDTRRQ